jgi:hypothetical protein
MYMYTSTYWRGNITHTLKNPSKVGDRPGPVHLAILNKIVRYLPAETIYGQKENKDSVLSRKPERPPYVHFKNEEE